MPQENNRLKIVFAGVLIGVLFFVPPALLVPGLIAFLGFLFGVTMVKLNEKDRPAAVLKIFYSGFALRILLCLLLAWLAYRGKGNIFFLGADDYGYALNASSIVSAWKETGYLPGPNSLWWMPWAGDLNYTYLIAFLYYFIGEYYLMTLFLNCVFGSLTVLLLYFITRDIFGRRSALIASGLCAFWPSLILWSTQNLKEPVTVFTIMIIFWLVLKLQKNFKKVIFWILWAVSLLFIYRVRGSIAIILLLVSVLALFLSYFRHRMKTVIPVLAVILVFSAMNQNLASSIFKRYGGLPSESIFQALNQAHKVRLWAADTAYLENTDISTPLTFLMNSPKFLLYIMFSPFPWQATKIKHVFGAMEMLIWFSLFFFMIKGIAVSIRYKLKETIFILIFLSVMIVTFFGEGNVGTLYRHRALIWPVMFIYTAVGLTGGSGAKSAFCQGVNGQ